MRFNTIHIYLAFLLTVLLFGCGKLNKNNEVKIYTHAVTGLYNPQGYFVDNTKEGFEYATSFEELDGLEMDVQFSKDSILWMFHDVLLDDRTNGEGRICEREEGYLSQLEFDKGKFAISKVKDLDLSGVQGVKTVYVDVKYLGSCNALSFSSQRLIEQCNELINHPSINVSFIINDNSLAAAMTNLGYVVFADGFSFEELDVNSTIYKGWFVRNSDLTEPQVDHILSANKSVILYEMYSAGSIKEAIRKSPSGVLVEEVKEAVLLGD